MVATSDTVTGGSRVDGASALGSRWRVSLAALLIVVLGACAYSNALNNPFIGIDTLQAVRDNPDIRSLTPLVRALSLNRIGEAAADDNSTLLRRPFLSLSFALNYAALGGDAWGFLVVNVAIHIAAGLLLFGIARRTLRRREYSAAAACWMGFSIAALWTVHPLLTESVSNIVQRAESLMGCLAFLTLYAAIRALPINDTVPAPRAWVWKVVATGACVLGMASKEIMVTVPPLVCLYDATFVYDGLLDALRRRWRFYAALAVTLAIPALLVALTLVNSARDLDPARMPSYYLSQPHVVMHYLRLVFWPDRLFYYINGSPFWFSLGVDPLSEVAPYAFPLGLMIAATVVALWRQHAVGFLGAAFFLPLVPTSFLATFTVIQEHRAYLSAAAVIALVVVGICRLATRGSSKGSVSRTATIVLVGLLVIALGGLVYRTRLRNLDYRSDLTLWAPDDLPLAFTMLGGLAVFHGRYGEAGSVFETLYDAALRAEPGQPLAAERLHATAALAAVRTLQGRYEEAQELYLKVLAEDPSNAAAENNRGVTYVLSGDAPAAKVHLQRAVAKAPRMAAAHFNYGLVLLFEGDTNAATMHFVRADDLLPPSARVGAIGRETMLEAGVKDDELAAVLSPSDQEFTIDFKLALTLRR